MTKKDSSCGSRWFYQEFIIPGYLTVERSKVHQGRVETEGLKQPLCTQLPHFHKLWRCLSGLCMQMEGLCGTVNTTDHSLLWYPCLAVSFQPLAVRPGDGRGWHRKYQPCPPEGLLHQLQAVPNCGCAAPESLFQSPVSGCWAAWGPAKASGIALGNILLQTKIHLSSAAGSFSTVPLRPPQWICVLLLFGFVFKWNIIDIKCYVSFRCTA